MSRTLAGKVALVTGGAGGIGRAVARALADEGVRVAVAGRDAAALATVDLGPGRPPPLAIPLDVRDPDAWDRTVARVAGELGGLDFLVHNAGIVDPGALAEIPAERTAALLETNLLGPMLGTRAALPALQARRGAVVHLASLGGIVPMPFEASYAASKAGLRQLSFSLRAELAPSGVAVSVVTPDSVDTPQILQELRHDEACLAFANPPLPPVAVARAVVRAIRTGAPEVLVPVVGGFAARLAAAFPWLLLRVLPLLRWMGRRRMARMRATRNPSP